MPSSTDLFDLIKSLKQTEKRHFKVYASKHSGETENQYIKLFDAIDRMEDYDEQAIIEKFKHEKFVKQLHVYKNYLENILLRSLASYHAKDSINAKLLELLRSIEVLYDKGLIDQCMKQIRKAEKYCREYEKFSHLIQVLEWKTKVCMKQSKLSGTLETVHESQKQLEHLAEFLCYKEKAFAIYEKVVKVGNVASEKDIEAFQDMMDDPLLQNENKPETVDALYYKYSCHSLYASIMNNSENHYYYNRKIVELLERNPSHIEENPHFYVSSLNNLCNAQMGLNKWDEIPKTVEKLRKIPEKYSTKKWEIAKPDAILLSYDIELAYCLNTGQIEQVFEIVNSIRDYLHENSPKIKKNNLLDTSFNVANALFILGRYEQSLDWLNKILNDHQLRIREDLFSVSKVVNLIIHYELGNHIFLQNILKSTYRFLKKREKMHRVEELFLSFLKKQMKAESKEEFLELLQIMRSRIEECADDPKEASILRYFDFISWIDSKIQGRSMAEVMQIGEKT